MLSVVDGMDRCHKMEGLISCNDTSMILLRFGVVVSYSLSVLCFAISRVANTSLFMLHRGCYIIMAQDVEDFSMIR